MGRVRIKDYEGKVETPYRLASHMVDMLFRDLPPSRTSRVLDAGCGRGVFIRAIIDWCEMRGIDAPEIVGVEIDEKLVREARERFGDYANVKIIQGDFLLMPNHQLGIVDYVIGNPPYVSYEKIESDKRKRYKERFKTAFGRFDTYIIFFERALELLKPGGRLVFVTPEKYLYTVSARELRKLLSRYHVEEIVLVDEDVFGGILAYPAITVVTKVENGGETKLTTRSGGTFTLRLPADGSSWLAVPGRDAEESRLKDVALRISAGVATGRDDIFIIPRDGIPEDLKPYAHPTVSGAELAAFKAGESVNPEKLPNVMLVPYDRSGRLLSEGEAGAVVRYLSQWKRELEGRYAVRSKKKAWYAFHEDPPLDLILRPKILWPDIAREPAFYADPTGVVIPRHTVYYLVPKNPAALQVLLQHLNSDHVRSWLKSRCQRAANGYLRLQSHVLKELPLPNEVYLKSVEPPSGSQGLLKWLRLSES